MVTGLTHPLHFFFSKGRDWRKRERERRRGCQYWYLVALVSPMLIGSLHLHKAVHCHARTGPPIPRPHTAQLERNKVGSIQADGLVVSGRLFAPPQCQGRKLAALPRTVMKTEKAALSVECQAVASGAVCSETSQKWCFSG